MRAVVSGGAGFIGSHLVDALVDRGDEVLVLDNLSTGDVANLAGVENRGSRLAEIDVCDFMAVEDALVRFSPDCVFHLAAQVDVAISVRDPGLDAGVNVGGTVNMLEASRRADCDRFVLASSCAVYGEPDRAALPLRESALAHPLSPYGQAKLAAEGYLELYRKLHGIRAASLRFANVYGPRQGSVGEAGVVSIFSRQLAAGHRPTVFGTGMQTRDFIFVADVTKALLAASEHGAGGVFNVGTGIETTVLDLIGELYRVAAGGDPDFATAPPRQGEIERMSLGCGHAEETLGWKAETGLNDGLAATWASLQAGALSGAGKTRRPGPADTLV